MPFVNPFPNPYPAPTPQLLYANNFSQPLPGSSADNSDAEDYVTGVAPTGYITFGCLVVQDPTVTTALQGGIGQGAKHPTSQADVDAGVLGLAVRTAAMESRRDGTPPGYLPGDPINIKRLGRMWTVSESGSTIHGVVYVRITANGVNGCTQLGALSDQADSVLNVPVTGIRWMDASQPGAPARVEFNFIGQ